MKLLLGVVALFALGCGSKSTVTVTKGLCNKADVMCGTYACGGNSAIVNAFPINGWRAGVCNEGIQVVPGSLDGPCQGQTLDIKNGKLVGIKSDGTEGCVEADLKGASFEIGGVAPGKERIAITDVKVGWAAPQGSVNRTAYQMEWADGSNKYGLCSKDGQKLRKKLGLKTWQDTDDLPDAKSELVIPVVDEAYGEEGDVLSGGPWNHLACVDDALAKRTLYGLEDKDANKNRTALRMLTADYCGSVSWTVRGEWIEWGNTNGSNVEAQWDEKGAKCLTAPRLLRDDNDQEITPTPSQHLKRLCKAHHPNSCKTAKEFMTEMKTCRDKDGNVVRTLEPCEECSDLTKCPLSSKNSKP